MPNRKFSIFGRAYAGDTDPHRRWRRGLIIGSSLLGIPITLISMTIRSFGTRSDPSIDWVGVGVLAAMATSLALARRDRTLRMAGGVLCAIPLVALPLSAWESGALRSPVALWFIIIPLVPSFVLGMRAAIVGTALVIAEAGLLAWAEAGGLVPASPVNPSVLANEVFLTISLCALATLAFARFYSRETDLANARLIEASKMASLGRMAGGVAHEVNTPLTIILGMTSRLLRDSADPAMDPAAREVMLRRIEAMTMRIAWIVKGLVDFAEHDAIGAPQLLRAQELVDRALSLCRHRLEAAGVELRLAVDPEATVYCHAGETGQALYNIIVNSEDAVRGLAERWIELTGSRTESGVVQLTCADSGGGIPSVGADMDVAPVFPTRPVGDGVGPGLSVARGLIERSRGRLWFDRGPRGARYIIELPAGK